MSRISLDLSSIKSAGVYTIEIDNSQRTETQVQALRLLVGFNGKGPFNRAVFLQNEAQRQKIFGDIDPKLEKKGCWFNRSAQTMLTSGPILALNLLKVDDTFDGPDQVNYTSLSLNAGKSNPKVADAGIVYGEVDYLAETIDAEVYGTSTGATIPFVGKTPYSSLFDRSRFWQPSENNLLQVAANGLGVGGGASFERANFINFANCGTDEISILVYKPEGLTGYDITAKDWYGGTENIPFGWIRPSDYISDYFIRVVAVKGNWSNYPILSSDSTWGKYFDQKGIKKDKIFQFSQADGITFIGSWTGVIIPDFTDKQGNYLYIKDRVNAQVETTGLLMSINEEAMEVVSYDLNGIDNPTGQQYGKGAWIYDYDNNSEADSESGENEIDSTKGHLIDMVGHGFQDGIKKETTPTQLENKFDTVIFDGSTGTLKDIIGTGDNKKVYYIDDANSVDISGVSYSTTVKVPEFATGSYYGTTSSNKTTLANGKPMFLYGVYDTSTNRRLGNEYCYVALTEDAFKDTSLNTAKIAYMPAFNAEGEAYKNENNNNVLISTVADSEGVNISSLKLKKDMKNNTKYTDENVLYGNYVAYDSSANQMFVYSIDSAGITDEELVSKESMVETTINVDGSDKNVLAYSVKAAGVTVYVDITGGKYYVDAETGGAQKFGINFLSYSYVSDHSEEVLCNIRNAYYFNGKNNTANPGGTVTLEDTNLFNGVNPVTADNLNMFIITDEHEAANITVGDLVQNITFNNNAGEATKFGLIPGVTHVTTKIFVNLTSDNKFSYKGNTYTFNSEITRPIRTRSGKRGFFLITAIDPVLICKNRIVRQLPISNDVISSSLRFIPLKGLHITSRHRPGYDENGRINIEAGIKKIYNVLDESGIQLALSDKNRLQFRYIIDSMSFGIDYEMGKDALSRLAQDRGATTAILNAPSYTQFAKSSNPVFTDTYDSASVVRPGFDAKYIPMGGNVDMYSTKLFTLPTEDDGSKYTAVFFPHLIYKDGNRNIIVPPAADVSNVFMRKYQGGDPYMICAGQNGIISNPNVVGVEYDADQYVRDAIEPFGINSIISENGVIQIYGNQTAFQNYKSDYNKLHVRENLNVLESTCDIILKSFNWKYNNPQTRAEVQQALVPIFEAMKTSRAIEWYSIICNETNNTEDIVAQDLLIVDSEVIMNHGTEKILHKITLKKFSDMPVE